MGIGDIVTEKKKQVDEWLKNQSRAGGNCRDFGRECRARYARKRSLSLVSSLFLAAMLIRLSLENQQPFPRSLSLSNALSLSLLL